MNGRNYGNNTGLFNRAGTPNPGMRQTFQAPTGVNVQMKSSNGPKIEFTNKGKQASIFIETNKATEKRSITTHNPPPPPVVERPNTPNTMMAGVPHYERPQTPEHNFQNYKAFEIPPNRPPHQPPSFSLSNNMGGMNGFNSMGNISSMSGINNMGSMGNLNTMGNMNNIPIKPNNMNNMNMAMYPPPVQAVMQPPKAHPQAPHIQPSQPPPQPPQPDAFCRLNLLSFVSSFDDEKSYNETDLESLGLDLKYQEPLLPMLHSVLSDAPLLDHSKHPMPECYSKIAPAGKPQEKLSLFSPQTLLFIFYTFPRDPLQIQAAAELTRRQYTFDDDTEEWKDPDGNVWAVDQWKEQEDVSTNVSVNNDEE
ncbi:hypothetical protein TRFO_19305 [Tritrichomonas foetus]|uniref:NOT2/NOT3/NOT5 C-terminal domain-containing protein n=1 Tax=Tritrichomonas foetus TaxID=1144522 RepID=A0A1J4KK44_9EUKA|nr:hypothetical protein TRFO_19305 [Tritrichomonas foetus]|eukprot:OHT11320.1 hypothetical protein TRFO_19305 [Tritrichomonas foetus]